MFESIWEDVKQQFKMGNMVTRLVILNVAVFMIVNLIRLIIIIANGWDTDSTTFTDFIHFFCLSSDLFYNLTHPWVIFTHMFLHVDFLHILFNMLYLYWFGRIAGDFIGDRKILPLYLLGGLVGALVYLISYKFLPFAEGATGYALGASAGVMAVVVASGTIAPNYIMRLILLGDIKLKYIVAALVFLDLVGIGGNYNTGGHFAHLGGAFFGWLFVGQLKSGNDLSIPVNNILDKVFGFFQELFGGRSSKRPKVIYKNPNIKKQQSSQKRSQNRFESKSKDGMSHQERVDSILDKIKQSGYESLTEEEKEFLFNASKK